MTIAFHAATSPQAAKVLRLERSPLPRLLGLGTAVPELCSEQHVIARRLASLWGVRGASLSRWLRIVNASEILSRHSVLPPEQVMGLTTAQRMIQYERLAPALAATAARRAVKNAGISASAITDLIVVSCTGFAAPGIDVALIDALDLKATVRRTMIGFMGCFGAISGLRTAVGACAANAEAGPEQPIALVVCVELCSLHIRADADAQNLVASALFSDGAAAAVVAGANRRSADFPSRRVKGPRSVVDVRAELSVGGSLLIKEGRDWMTWRVTDAGFAMTLTRDVPRVLRERLAEYVGEMAGAPPQSFIVHPGGPGIIDAVDAALGLQGGRGLEASRAVLRRFGNMSSATVLFVLEEMLDREMELPALMLAFGPGLTIESLSLLPPQHPRA